MRPNDDIRLYAGARGVKLWQIAAALGIPDGWFSKLLRQPLSEEKRTEVKRIVDEISEVK